MALVLMEFDTLVFFIQLFNQFLSEIYIGSVLFCVLGIQGKETKRESTLSGTGEKYNHYVNKDEM